MIVRLNLLQYAWFNSVNSNPCIRKGVGILRKLKYEGLDFLQFSL